MPANVKISLSQWAIVHKVTGLCDYLIAMNSLQESDHKLAVAASYCCKVSTGRKLVLSGNDGKNSLRTLPCEDCFARVA